MEVTKGKLDVHIRWMIRRDMKPVLRIERQSFPSPWAQKDFENALRQRNCIGMVAEDHSADDVSGYMIYELYGDHLCLINLAVNPAVRRCSVGSQLMEKLHSKLSPQRRKKLRVEVCESNLNAQCFFRQLGFRATGVVDSPYASSDEDAYLMELGCGEFNG